MDEPKNNEIINNNNYSLNDSSNNINQNNNENEEEEEHEEKEEADPTKEIELLYESLLEFYSKKQFKKILKTIVLKADKEEKFNMLEWKLIHLRTFTLQKILEKKNSDYYKSSKIPHFSEYIQKLDNDINNWLSFTKELNNQNQTIYSDSFLEFIILFILQKIVTLSKSFIHSGHIKDTIGFLSLGVRLINSSFYFFKSPDSYALAGEIFLILSSFMMAEENFNTAKTFISISIKFSFLCLETKLFKNGINYKLFNLIDYKNELPNFSKLFFNLSVAFYQLGICYENECEPYNAFYAIKTSKIFGIIIENEDIELFIELIKDIEKRLLMKNRIILFFEKNVKKEEMEEKIVTKKRIYNKLFDQEQRRILRFKGIKNYIEKLKLVDIDDDEPDLFNKVGYKPKNEKVLKTTKQLHLLNFLLSDDFKEVIHKMNKMEINKCDKDTINKIQKKIISLKNNERAKIEEKNKNEIEKIKRLKEKKMTKEIKKDKDEKISLIRTTKSNTLKSTSIYSMTTSITRKPRIHSAYKTINRKNLLAHNEQQSNKTLKTYDRPATSDSIFNSPSRYLSITENYNYLNSNNNKAFSRDRIMNAKKNNTLNQKYQKIKFENYAKQKIKKNKKNVFKYTPKYIPKYDYNNYFFNKKYKIKYNYLEKQYDREIDFQKQLLKTKFIKEYSIKPESVDVRDIYKKVDELYYTTFENELMNAKEKQIIFDKTELMNTNKSKFPRRMFSADQKVFSSNTQKEKEYLNINQITETNNDCINDITNKILKISSQEKAILRKKRKILK